MAFQRADPAPFIPEGLLHDDIPNRVFMVRAVAPVTPPARNEDLTIVNFNLLPGHEMNFYAVRSVLRDLLRFERPTTFLDIQPTSLGQALVRFHHSYDRDTLVAESLIEYGDVTVSFCKHNEGRNWRRAAFDQECWILILGLPNDYWTERHICSIVGDFGRVQRWVADDRMKCRLLVRITVASLDRIPQFIVYEDPEKANGESWTL
jgi:hypothetical protein